MMELMSTSAERFRTLSTRLVMGGAFVGALVVLTLSMVFSWPVGGTANAGANDPAANLAAAFDAPPGSCLTWKPDGSDMRPTGCDQPHLFEVTGDVDISGEHGPNDPSPTADAWRDIAKQKCATGATAYLGGKLDPFGRYSVGALKPSDDQWRSGDRKLRCGLQRQGPTGKILVPTTGSAKGQDQSDVYDVGTCLALADKTYGDPVPCKDAHAFEIVGVVDLGKVHPDGFPSDEQQQAAMLDNCTKQAAEYSSNLNLADKGLSLTWDTRKQESWDAGSRKAVCKVGAPLKDGTGLAPVSGSVKNAGAPAPPPSSVASSTPPSQPGG
ncbi:septum formation family protein [Actinocrispum wychmicini]|uniref:Putative regulator of septum formation n=1 Tax=Actinocrispum wychmicini TaxID=1213861 RepID=A0A4R2KDA8_9PSEU|nr:septum formation family protein [Actinocrispum wychmicini]TCO64495.1 putative regulator of septum formation [Actinocrispum wychmicini]